jgi:hypothetical protein
MNIILKQCNYFIAFCCDTQVVSETNPFRDDNFIRGHFLLVQANADVKYKKKGKVVPVLN